MLIVCPSCASEYEVDPVLLGPNGRKMRCASCREVFFATPEGADEDAFDDAAANPWWHEQQDLGFNYRLGDS